MADVDNLKIQLQLNAAIEERGKLLAAQTSQISDQVELAAQFCKAMKCEDIEKIGERINEIRAGLKSAGKSAQSATDDLNDLVNGLDQASKGSQKLKTAAEEAEESFKKFSDEFGKGFSKGMALSKGFLLGIFDITKGIANLAIGLLKLPLTVFDKMTEAAGELAGNTAIFEAKEQVREAFGDIDQGFAKQVIEGADSIAASLAKSGRTLADTFGVGPEGKAGAILASKEIAEALGDTANLLGQEFGAAAGDLFMLQKGMGLTGDDLKGLTVAATVTGRKVGDLAADVQKLSMSMGAGMNVKAFARDMTYMLTNTAKYGKLSATQIAATTAYVKKLGLEVKQIESLVAAFDDFESAATNASKLAQAFGMNVDAMKMMKEQDPGKRLEMLRSSFAATGRSIDSMTRQEKQLLASTAGLDESIVEQALSAKNMGKSYKQLNDDAEKSAKKQKSQQQMFEELGNAIKKLTESLSYGGGFLNNFLQGIGEGAARSGPMRQVLGDIAGALRKVRMFGREVGDMFIKMFPGVKDMLGAMHDFFKASNFKKTINDFREVVKKLFLDLDKDPKRALEKFSENLKKKFTDIFDRSSPAGRKFLDGAEKFFKTVGALIAAGVKIIGEKLADGIKQFAEFIRHPEAAIGQAKGMGQSFFTPIIASLADVMPKVGAAIFDLFKAMVVRLAPTIMKFIAIALSLSIAMGLISAVTSGAKMALAEVVKNKVLKMLSKAVANTAAPPLSPATVGTGPSVGGFVAGFKAISAPDIVKAGAKMMLIAVMLTVAAAAMIGGMILIGKMIKAGGGMDVFVDGLLSLGAAILAIVGISYAAKFISPGSLVQASVGLLAGALFMIPLGLFMMAVNKVVSMVGTLNGPAIIDFAVATASAVAAIAIAFGAAALAGAALVSLGGWTVIGAALIGLGLMAGGLYGLGVFMVALSDIVDSMGPIDSDAIVKFSFATAAALGSMAIAFAAATVAGALSITGAAGAILLGIYGGLLITKIGGFIDALNTQVQNNPIDTDAVADYSQAVAASLGWIALAFGAATVAGAASIAGVAGAVLLATTGWAALAAISFFMDKVASYASQKTIDTKKVTDYTDAVNSVLLDFSVAMGAATAAGLASVLGAVGAGLLVSTGWVALNAITFFVGKLNEAVKETKVDPEGVETYSDALVKSLWSMDKAFGMTTAAGLASVGALVGSALLASAGVSALKDLKTFFVDNLIPMTQNMNLPEVITAGAVTAVLAQVIGSVVDAMLLVTEAGALLMGSSILEFFTGSNPLSDGLNAIGQFLKSIEKDFLPSLQSFAGVTVPTGVGKTAKLMADLIGGMTPAVETFLKIQETSGGWFTTAAEEADNTKKMMDSLGKFISTISESVSKVFSTIMTAALLLVVDDTTEKKFEMVGKGVELTTRLFSSFTGVLGSLPRMEAKTGRDAALVAISFMHILDATRTAIFGPNGMLKLMMAEVPRILDLMRDAADKLPKDPKELKALAGRVDLISKIIETFVNIASTISTLSGAIPTTTREFKNAKGKVTKTVTEQIPDIKDYFDKIVNAFTPQLQKLVDKFQQLDFGGVDLRSMREKAKLVYIAMNTFTDLSKLVSSIPLEEIKAADPNAPTKETYQQAVERMYAGATWALWGVNELGNWITASGGVGFLTAQMDSVTKTLAKVPDAYSKIGDSISNMQSAIAKAGEVGEISQTNWKDNVTKMLTDMAELDAALTDLHIGPIDAKIDRLAKNLEVSRESISINHKPININLQMNVSFAAENFTKDIFKVAGKLTKEGNFNLSSFAKTQYDEAKKTNSGF